MPSFGDAIFGRYGSPALMKYHGDPVAVQYVLNGASTDLIVIKGIKEYVTIIDPEGLEFKRHRQKITINRDSNETNWGSLDMPAFRGTFTIDGETWALDDQDGEGARNMSPNFVELSLVQSDPLRETYEDHHRRI